jgi:3',5'-nucleoside bisphosphate phosphatase
MPSRIRSQPLMSSRKHLLSSSRRMRSTLPKTAVAIRSAAPGYPRDGADLHVHTTHSDGACSPCEVVVAAARVGLRAVAITDHDTVSALAVARPEAARWGIELVAGVELTCENRGREFHILGHFIRDDDRALLDSMASLRAGRAQRIEAMVARLRSLGLSIDLGTIRRVFPRASLGRRHLADFLTRTRQVASTREVFVRFLGDGCPARVDKPRLDTGLAIALIKGAGGVAALAHPPHDLGEARLREIAAQGLHAIEVEGPGFSTGKSRRLQVWANRLGLVGIAGSDFHSADRPGRWVGAIVTAPDDLERLRRLSQSCSRSSVAESTYGQFD